MMHPDEDLELYAIGSLDEVSAARIEAHARSCISCHKRLAQAQSAAAALATPATMHDPPESLRGRILASAIREKPRHNIAPAWTALAAGVLIGVGVTLPLNWATRSSINRNDAALSTLVASHFSHAAFRPIAANAPPAKLLYGRHGEWIFAIVHSTRRDLHIVAFRDGARQDLGALQPQGSNETLFLQSAHRPAKVQIEAGATPIAEVTPAYSR